MAISQDTKLEKSLVPNKGGPIRITRRKRWGDTLAPYLFLSPFILSFLVFFLGPALYSLVLSFFRYAGYGNATFTGLNNYQVMLNYKVFWIELGNVLFYWIAHAIPLLFISFLLAVLVHSKVVEHKSLIKPLLFLPRLVTGVAAAMLFKNFFGTQYGLLNTMLGLQIPWLDNMVLARWVVVIVTIWRSTSWWFVIFLAGLTSINTEVVEAAIVDGANAWQRLIYITIPLMRRTFLAFFVLDAISSIRIFDTPNVMGSNMGGLAPVDMAPLLNLVVDGIRNAVYGQAAAVGWLMFLLIALVSWLQFRVFKDED